MKVLFRCKKFPQWRIKWCPDCGTLMIAEFKDTYEANNVRHEPQYWVDCPECGCVMPYCDKRGNAI